jgi:hypothetical protein
MDFSSVDWFLFGLWLWGILFFTERAAKDGTVWNVLHLGAWVFVGLYLQYVLKGLLLHFGVG